MTLRDDTVYELLIYDGSRVSQYGLYSTAARAEIQLGQLTAMYPELLSLPYAVEPRKVR